MHRFLYWFSSPPALGSAVRYYTVQNKKGAQKARLGRAKISPVII
jgi:hypothetical protein